MPRSLHYPVLRELKGIGSGARLNARVPSLRFPPLPFKTILKAGYAFSPIPPGVDGESAITLPFAKELLGARVVYLTCGLTPFLEGETEYYDFHFGIDIIDEDGTRESFSTQDREIAKAFIPQDIRAQIMALVCEAFRELVGDLQPERVYYVSKGKDLPEKALAKYQKVTEAAEAIGYSVHEMGTDVVGRRYWILSR